MKNRLRGSGSLAQMVMAMIGMVLVTASSAFAQVKVQGPIAVGGSAGYPFDAVSHHKVSVSLQPSRYREDEFFFSGDANVYRYADHEDSIVAASHGPYSTRILIRRPQRPDAFSGNVIVELYNAAARFDQAFVWADLHRHILSHGDIWIGVTARPSAIAALKRFNPARYASLALTSPDRAGSTCANLAADSEPGSENGLVYDLLTQVGAWAKSSRSSGPLAGYRVRAVYAAGFSQTASVLFTYIGAIAPRQGAHPFDGYYVAAGSGRGPLSQCASPLPAGDRRVILHGGKAAVIQMQTQSEFTQTIPYRRPDSDDPVDRYRLYEVPGVSHVNASQTPFLPDAGELKAVGLRSVDQLVTTCALPGPFNPLPSRWAAQAAFAGLERWVGLGRKPPHASRLVTVETETGPVAALDRFGNAQGGVRNPWIDVPLLTYTASSAGPAALPALRVHPPAGRQAGEKHLFQPGALPLAVAATRG